MITLDFGVIFSGKFPANLRLKLVFTKSLDGGIEKNLLTK